MTYLLVCLLCTGSPGDRAVSSDSPGAALTLQLHDAARMSDLGREALSVDGTVPVSFSDQAPDGGPGRDQGLHMGPLWIMMGVMMVGMMVVAGAYMMRGHWATPVHATAIGSPQQAAIPPVVGFRPGG